MTSGRTTMRTILRNPIFASALLVSIAIVVGAALVARATPGGQTKDALSFAGTLRQNGQPLMGAQSLTFNFKKAGLSICAPQVMVTADATGAFNAQIDISNCPGTLFD